MNRFHHIGVGSCEGAVSIRGSRVASPDHHDVTIVRTSGWGRSAALYVVDHLVGTTSGATTEVTSTPDAVSAALTTQDLLAMNGRTTSGDDIGSIACGRLTEKVL